MFLISARETSAKVTEKIIDMLDMRYNVQTATIKNIAKASDDPHNAVQMGLRQANMLIVVIDPDWLQNPDEPNLNPLDRFAVQMGLKFLCPMMLVFVDGAQLPNPLPDDLLGLEKQQSTTITSMLMQSGINGLAQVVAPYVGEKQFAPILDSDAVVAASLSTEEREIFTAPEPTPEVEKVATPKRNIPRPVQLVAFMMSLAVIVMILIILFDSLKR
ncbi:MAG: hypothetical protein MUE54_08440 [Anaerolineae bacterium]|jgi:hypothetical protein|nr:hypothetical protein [Anaerolineae bacterium]